MQYTSMGRVRGRNVLQAWLKKHVYVPKGVF
jgi:hypothetical protein